MQPLARLFTRLWRYFWQLTALLLILCALVVQLGRMATPLVADYREPLVQYLSDQLSLQVRIDALAARWESLVPVLALEGLVVSTPSGKAVLEVESALAEVDLLASLWERQLRFTGVEFLGVRSNFVQAEDGRLRLEGLRARDDKPTATNYSLDDLRGIFLVGRNVNLIDLRTQVTLQSGHEIAVVVNRLLLEHGNGRHRLSASLQLEDRAEAVRITMEGSGDPFDISEFGSRAHLQIVDFPTERLLALAARDFWQGLPEGEWRREGKASVDAWLTLTPNEGIEGVGKIALSGLPFELADREIPFRTIASELIGSWRFDGSWALQMQNVLLQWGDKQHPPFAVKASVDAQKLLTVKTDNLQLPLWHHWLSDTALLPEKLQDVMNTLAPKGELHNARLRWPLDDPTGFTFAANLAQVSAQAWRGAPAVTQVDGYVFADAKGGFVDLDSQQGFSMHYTTVYKKPMAYSRAKGQVAWTLRPDIQSVFINSGPVHLTGEDGDATGFVYIDAPMGRDDKTLELLLQIGIENSAAEFHKKYVPFVVSKKLRRWLDKSVGTGKVAQGGFLFHGFMGGEHKRTPNVQLWLDIHQATLDYQPPWPKITDVQAQLLLDQTALQVSATQGRLYDSDLQRARVELVADAAQAMRLKIQAQLAGPLQDAEQLLRASPLAEATGQTFSEWELAGSYTADVSLDIPMSEGGAPLDFDVRMALADAQLALPFINLQAEQLSGDLRVHAATGVSIAQMTGQLWGQPLKLQSALQGDVIDFAVQTQADIQDLLAWAGAPPQPQLAGQSHYRANILVPWQLRATRATKPPVRLKVHSTLAGLQINLPAPFGKSAKERLPFNVSLPLTSNELILVADVGELVDAQLRWVKSDTGGFQFERGDIHLLGQARLPKQPMLRVRGQLPQVDLSAWMEAFSGQWSGLRAPPAPADIGLNDTVATAPVSPPVPNSEAPTVSPPLPLYLVLSAQQVLVDATHDVGETQLEAIQSAVGWRVNVRNERIAGDLDMPFDASAPIDLSLNYLRLPLWPESEMEPKPQVADTTAGTPPQPLDVARSEALWAAIKPLPPLRVSIASLYQRDSNLGQLRFDSRLHNDTLTLSNIKGSLYGLRFEVDGSTGLGAQLAWRKGLGQSDFKGVLLADDLGQVMSALAMEKSIESRSARFVLDVGWPGDPGQLQMAGLTGAVDFSIAQGRFLRADASASNALMRLMGILNFDTWIRRLQLDFSDVYASGMAYDEVKGGLAFDRGQLTLATPVAVRTPSSKMQMAGRVDLIANTLDTRLTVNLPVLDNLTFLAAVSAGLPVAAGVFVASRLFEKQFDQMTSVNYRVTGPLDNPVMQFVQISDASTRPVPQPAAIDKPASQSAPTPSADTPVPDAVDAGPSPDS